MNLVLQSLNVFELLFKPQKYYAQMLNTRFFPWLTLVLGPLVFGLALSLLTRNYYGRLEKGSQILGVLVAQGFLTRFMFYLAACCILMLIAGYDSEPFRVLAFSSSIVLFWSVLLLIYAALFPIHVEFPNSVGVQIVTRMDDRLDAFQMLSLHPAIGIFTYSTLAIFGTQCAWAYFGLLEAGANPTNAKAGLVFCILCAMFCSILGLFVPAFTSGIR
jgi:magnesium-transporting ATPase (P-type)